MPTTTDGRRWQCDGCGREVFIPLQLVGHAEADIRLSFDNVWAVTPDGSDLCTECFRRFLAEQREVSEPLRRRTVLRVVKGVP